MVRLCIAVVLLLSVAGCGEQKYSVWRVGGRPADRVAVEKGLDRAACELIVQRLEKKQEEAQKLSLGLRMEIARLGGKDDSPFDLGYRYSCEPDA